MAIDKILSESINLADNFAFTGTVSGAGGVNTPSFLIKKDSSQTLNDNTMTKITFTSEVSDTDNAFADSKFTVPSGKAGTYVFTSAVHWYDANTSIASGNRTFKVNGNQTTALDMSIGSANFTSINQHQTYIVALSAGDYVEVYTSINTADGGTASVYGEGQLYSWFSGYKIII